MRHALTIMGYQMAVAYTGSTLLPPFLGFLAKYASIGLFPFYIVLSAAAMLLFSEKPETIGFINPLKNWYKVRS
jgi:hypothetical protein